MHLRLKDIDKLRDMRVRLVAEVRRWPNTVAAAYNLPFCCPGWQWETKNETNREVILRLIGTPYHVTERIWRSDRGELLCEEAREDTGPEEPLEPFTVEPADARGVSVYNSLENLVQSNVDKTLTTWQRNQLKRWDGLLQAYPPENALLLTVEESQEIKKKRHQIERICAVSGVSKARAENMYDSGIRVIEQE